MTECTVPTINTFINSVQRRVNKGCSSLRLARLDQGVCPSGDGSPVLAVIRLEKFYVRGVPPVLLLANAGRFLKGGMLLVLFYGCIRVVVELNRVLIVDATNTCSELINLERRPRRIKV